MKFNFGIGMWLGLKGVWFVIVGCWKLWYCLVNMMFFLRDGLNISNVWVYDGDCVFECILLKFGVFIFYLMWLWGVLDVVLYFLLLVCCFEEVVYFFFCCIYY